jgi:cytoskeleton protein RodZ
MPIAAPPKTEPTAIVPAKETTASDDSDSEDENADDASTATAKDDGVINIKRGKSRITLKATEASWVQVTDANRKVLYRKVLRPGEQYSVPDQPGLILDTANAGGLEIVVDGKPIHSIGRDGDIVRGIALEPQTLKKIKALRE